MRNSLTATCDTNTFRPVSEFENIKNTETEKAKKECRDHRSSTPPKKRETPRGERGPRQAHAFRRRRRPRRPLGASAALYRHLSGASSAVGSRVDPSRGASGAVGRVGRAAEELQLALQRAVPPRLLARRDLQTLRFKIQNSNMTTIY